MPACLHHAHLIDLTLSSLGTKPCAHDQGEEGPKIKWEHDFELPKMPRTQVESYSDDPRQEMRDLRKKIATRF